MTIGARPDTSSNTGIDPQTEESMTRTSRERDARADASVAAPSKTGRRGGGAIDILRREDVPQVADLFMRVFARQRRAAPPELTDYIERLHFDDPAYDPERGSLVHRDARRGVVGFLGGFPLDMRYLDRPVRGVVAGSYMIDPDAKDPLGPLRLVRASMDRKPDLFFSDTANDVARRIWSGMGVSADPVLSLGWARPLRPLRFALKHWAKRAHGSRARVARLLSHLMWLPDEVVNSVDRRRSVADEDLRSEELTVATFVEGAPRIWADRSVVPAYGTAHVAWKLDALAERTRYGPLRKRAVRDADDQIVGWYIYYPNAGAIGQVVQVAARPNLHLRLLRHLLLDAREHGSLGLVGKVDPPHTDSFTASGCILFQRRTWTLLHSQSPEIRDALLTHDVMLSRMEGDWWTRLSGGELID